MDQNAKGLSPLDGVAWRPPDPLDSCVPQFEWPSGGCVLTTRHPPRWVRSNRMRVQFDCKNTEVSSRYQQLHHRQSEATSEYLTQMIRTT